MTNKIRGKCIKCTRRTQHLKNNEFVCAFCDNIMPLEDKLPPFDSKILELVKDSKISINELRTQLHGSKELKSTGKPYSVKGTKIVFGVFGDSHIGHNCFDSKLMDYAIEQFNKRKVDFVIHTGDICEGHYENRRQGSVFELSHVGGDAQVKEAVKHLSKLNRPLYFVTGNHETNTFYKMSGFDIGKQLQDALPNSRYLGIQHGVLNLDYGRKIQIIHPDGGTAYALSYKVQKIAESLEGGTKPDILLVGHFHKAEYLFYRNIHVFQTATMESQTPFMKNNHISAHKGFYIITANISKDGVSKITPEFFPAY